MSSMERGLIVLVAVIVLAVGSYIWGWNRGYMASEVKWKAEKAALIAQAEKRAAELEAEGSRLRSQLEIARANVKIEYVEVIREVQKVASAARREPPRVLRRQVALSQAGVADSLR